MVLRSLGETFAGCFELQQFHKRLVALSHQLREIARADLVGYSGHHAVAEVGVDRETAEVAPHTLGRLPQRLVEQSADAALSTRQMQVEEWSEQRPAQARAVGDGCVHVRDACDTG